MDTQDMVIEQGNGAFRKHLEHTLNSGLANLGGGGESDVFHPVMIMG